ncbi:TetR/AcrR family transcriptional regulator [Demequina sp. NBRC 110052]|uniref:TetR/AcrR family transcriptional regulator n=1 Tax=Demequina sp. NBRC 110052 TaxID=1570341 RepID=UPI000A0130E8|nr:TetR family transcriptional regulator [Demequina sp. NBRC 110052]
MARMTLEDRRSALVAAALAVIEREGVAGATARSIVREAGMPLGSLHYAFSTVEELLGAAADEVTTQERLAAERALGDHSQHSDIASVIRAGFDRYIDLLVAAPGRELAFLELTMHAARRRLAAPAAAGTYDESYRLVGALLTQAAAASGVRWTIAETELARHTVSMLDGITTTWLADHDTEAARSTARFYAHALASHTAALAADG